MYYTFQRQEKGTQIISKTFEVFFGNRNYTKTLFLSEKFETRLLKQVHGETLIYSSQVCNKNPHKADAHWTSVKNIALGIITADCLPIFAIDLKKNLALGIHAGWKGLEKYIVFKSLKTLSFSHNSLIFIGPHIQKESFEVSNDIAEKLSLLSKEAIHKKFNKKYVDLSWIAKIQMMNYGIASHNIYIHDDDTFSNNNYFSYRQGESKRQISYIKISNTG